MDCEVHALAPSLPSAAFSPSGYYAWRKRPASLRKQRDSELLRKIRTRDHLLRPALRDRHGERSEHEFRARMRLHRPADDHHSGQGTQYTSIAFGLRCKEASVRPSMGSVGDAYDNAMCESFFATLEHELLARERFRTQAEARMAVFDFIEGWYNPRRRHSALGYQSPNDFERSYALREVPESAELST